MSEKAFDKLLRGLKETQAYMEGARQDYKVTVPPTVDVKSIRKKLNMTQAAFSDNFGFSLDAVKHWEGGRRTPEVPARGLPDCYSAQPCCCVRSPAPEGIVYGPAICRSVLVRHWQCLGWHRKRCVEVAFVAGLTRRVGNGRKRALVTAGLLPFAALAYTFVCVIVFSVWSSARGRDWGWGDTWEVPLIGSYRTYDDRRDRQGNGVRQFRSERLPRWFCLRQRQRSGRTFWCATFGNPSAVHRWCGGPGSLP